ncbi:hypothetical protein IJ182_10965 [bacterium]|nr:hypothetical protein [bacterium]
MKKLLLFFLLLCFILNLPDCYAKKDKAKSLPDPLYLNSEVKDFEQIEEKSQKEPDPRTLDEKVRDKMHIKRSKKIHYHNIDKSNIPVTVDDYYELAQDKKRKDFEIPEPKFEHSPDIVLPDSHFRVVSYNVPPGQRNIDLTKLVGQRTVSSPGILSPDKKKMVYTQSFFYPRFQQTSSSAYVIETNEGDAYDVLLKTNVMQGDFKPIVSVGMDYLQQFQYKTLFPIDFSKDSSKIAFKEKIGSNIYETWQTNVIIYDFKTKNWKRLTAVREAIIYWWRQNKQIELKDYMWDIYPIGWDKNNPERLIVYAYAFTKERPLFLGTWSIDYDEQKSQLISIDSTDANIDLNGFGLKEIKFEN